MGEALNRLRHDDPVVAARVPDVVRSIGFRNALIHGYDIVDRDRVWQAITVEIPALIQAVDALLAELDAAAQVQEAAVSEEPDSSQGCANSPHRRWGMLRSSGWPASAGRCSTGLTSRPGLARNVPAMGTWYSSLASAGAARGRGSRPARVRSRLVAVLGSLA